MNNRLLVGVVEADGTFVPYFVVTKEDAAFIVGRQALYLDGQMIQGCIEARPTDRPMRPAPPIEGIPFVMYLAEPEGIEHSRRG